MAPKAPWRRPMIRSYVMSVPWLALTLAGTSALSCVPVRGDDGSPVYQRRLFYVQMNLQVAENADRLDRPDQPGEAGRLQRLRAGRLQAERPRPRPGALLHQRGSCKSRGRGGRASRSSRRSSRSATARGCWPTTRTWPRGCPWSTAPFVVRGREAVLDPHPAPQRRQRRLRGRPMAISFGGFRYQDDAGVATFADRVVTSRRNDLATDPGPEPRGKPSGHPARRGAAVRLLSPLGLGQDPERRPTPARSVCWRSARARMRGPDVPGGRGQADAGLGPASTSSSTASTTTR